MRISQATIDDLEGLVPLFEGYRAFYGQAPDARLAREFLSDRLRNNDSTIFIARTDDGQARGFTQLYPSFTSAGCARIFVLNDLFVAPSHRGTGLGARLLSVAADFGRQMGAVRLTLSTGVGNQSAQSLYERGGWEKNEAFYTYNLML